MSEAICEFEGCGKSSVRVCSRCRRQFCARHIEPVYPDVAPDRSPWRCAPCTKEIKQETRQHTRRSKRGLIGSGVLVLLGIAVYVIGTSLAPDSDEVTFAAIVGMCLVGVGVISAVYQALSR